MSRILLALQFWHGDKEQAMKVARLIADLEPRHSERVDFLFVARFDTTHDMDTVKHVAAKFNVKTFINRHRRGVGWPFGCNDLWFGCMDHIYTEREAGHMPDYKFILTLEADSSPLRRDWILRLEEFWDKARVKVCGPMIPHGPPESGHKHINGNAMFSGDMDFLRLVSRKIGGCNPAGGWDWLLAPRFMKLGWANCPLMRSHWRAPNATEGGVYTLQENGVVFLHGVKDDSVLSYIRKTALGQHEVSSRH
jgi:hypothetical protein